MVDSTILPTLGSEGPQIVPHPQTHIGVGVMLVSQHNCVIAKPSSSVVAHLCARFRQVWAQLCSQ